MKDFIKKVLLLVNFLTLLPLCIATLAQFIPAEQWWLPSTLAIFYPFWFIIPIVWGLIWLRFYRGGIVLNIIVLLLNYNHIWNSFQVSSSLKSSKKDIKTISMNVASFGYYPNQGRKVADFIARYEPDIVCLQEFRTRLEQAGQTSLNTIPYFKQKWNLKYHAFNSYNSDKEYGLIIFSKFPIQDHDLIKIKNSTPLNGMMYADLKLYSEKLRIYNVHLQSYQFSKQEKNIIAAQNISQLVDQSTKSDVSSNKASSPRKRISKKAFNNNAVSNIGNHHDNLPRYKKAKNGRTRKLKYQEPLQSAQNTVSSHKSHGDYKTDKNKHSPITYWKMAKQMLKTWRIHSLQTKSLTAHQNESQSAILSLGDLNNTPYQSTYQKVKGTLIDCFTVKGTGMGTTYGTGIYRARIDYIFASKHFKVVTFKTLPTEMLSDHNANYVRLRFRFHQE